MNGSWAVVVSVVAGGVLSSLGAYLNDFFGKRREERQAHREQRERQELWAREEESRKQSQLQEAYKRFAKAASLAEGDWFDVGPEQKLLSGSQMLDELIDSYSDIQLTAPTPVAQQAGRLYRSAYNLLFESHASMEAKDQRSGRLISDELQKERDKYWRAIRMDLGIAEY